MTDIPTVNCRTAKELLKQLDPANRRWGPFEYGRWVFRGQVDASWPLIPSALRRGRRLSYSDPSVTAPLASMQDQILAELELLSGFAERADELGFALPGDMSELRFPWKRHEEPVMMNRSWPWTSILELAAIAQHHGIPTRLLDFTHNPLVAAFFGASDSTRAGEQIGVWAVDLNFVYRAWPLFGLGIRAVQVSRAPNPFLHAQSGLFLYDASGGSEPLDEKLLEVDLQGQSHLSSEELAIAQNSERVVRFTLPKREQAALRKLLRTRRVTEAHLRPTLDNVAAELWRKSDYGV